MPKNVIMCVDDERIIIDSIMEQLERHFGNKYCYEAAESAEDALEILDEYKQDGIDVLVIVSDWLMPGLKGDEFLIIVHQEFPDIVKIMLTGQADDEAVKRAKTQANLHCKLNKPWKAEELIEAIESGLKILRIN